MVDRHLPPAEPGTALRILSTSDLGTSFAPMPTSFGSSGTCAGIAELLEQEQERQPTVWLDAGDLVVGSPAYPLLGSRPWDEVEDLSISAAAVGNHNLDDGVSPLLEAARKLSFPMLCANADVGLPESTVVETPAGPLGVIGLTNPRIGEFGLGPQATKGWPYRVEELARELRSGGARWVVAILHDGAEWWPNGSTEGGTRCGFVHTRPDRLQAIARPWAGHMDLVLCGHNFGGWSGRLDGTPAGHASVYASSILIVDVPAPPASPRVRGSFTVPARRPATSSASVEAADRASERVVGKSRHTWITKTGARHYLPDLLATALRDATDADAGLVLPGYHSTQAPLDGAVAALCAGEVTELDLVRFFDDPDDTPMVVQLGSGEFGSVVEAYEKTAGPHNRAGDRVWWNWCRMPAGVSTATDDPGTVALMPPLVGHLTEWLGRDVVREYARVGAREALSRALQ